MSKEQKELYEFGDFRLDVSERRLERADGMENCALPEKAFQTLVHLVRNSGELLTKEELLSAVWPDTIVEENNLGKAVHTVRQCLGERSGEHKYIETVPKHGYRFVAAVRSIGAINANLLLDQSDIEPETRDENVPRPMQHQRFAIAALLFIALASMLFISLRGSSLFTSTPEKVEQHTNARLERSPAYDLYIRGKVKVASENREDTLAAIKILEQAIIVDPDLAEAHAQLARGYNTIAFKYSSGAEAKRYHENAEVAIEKAINLNPELAEAHFARGLILWTYVSRFPHEKAIQSFKRSLELDPNQDETYHQLSLVYSHIGLLPEAEAAVNQALQRNPNNTLARFRAGVYIAYQGRFEEAIAIFKTIPRDFTPLIVDRSMAEALIQAGRSNEAEIIVDEYLRKYPQDEGGSFTSVKALLLAKAGKHKEAEEAIKRAAEIGEGYGHFHHTAYNIASAYAAMNMPMDAVKWLEFAAENGFPNYPYFASDPNLENIRGDQRFIDFMNKLLPQWEKFKAIA